MNSVQIFTFLTCLVLLLSCDRAPSELHLIQERQSGDFAVVLLSNTPEVQQTSNDFVLEFRDALTNDLAQVDNVRIQATMPMPGMAPMFGDISSPRPDVEGRYEFTADLTMAGGWNIVVNFDSDQRVQFNVNAR